MSSNESRSRSREKRAAERAAGAGVAPAGLETPPVGIGQHKLDNLPHAAAVRFDDLTMYVDLEDGRAVAVPLAAYKRLEAATREQLQNYRISFIGLHWPDIDEDLTIAGLVRDFGSA